MQHRDQNQTSGRRGGGRQQESSMRTQGSRYGRGQDERERGLDEDRDWQSQQRYGGSRMSGPSAGQRFGETYNPEPQWLRDDRDYNRGGSRAARDEDLESEYRGGSRGSYASSGRPWGEQDFREGTYGADYGSREFGERGEQGYGMSQGSQYGGQSGASQSQYGSQYGTRGGYGGPNYGSQNFQRNLGGRAGQSGYGASRGGGGLHEYGTPGYETAGYDSDLGYGGQSMSGRGYGSQYRAGSGTGYSSGGYGSGSGYQLGTHQGDTGYQRSYRGMGPQNYKRPDERIRDDVYERLTDSHEIDARHIMVDVNQGNVTLTGTVPERQMRYAAEDLVESCMGVSNINNQLKVQDTSESGTSGLAGSTGTAGSTTSSTSTESKRH